MVTSDKVAVNVIGTSKQCLEVDISSCKVYRIRWVILGLFVICCASSTMQWVQYSIIADVTVDYYGVSYNAVNWSSMLYLLCYVLFIFPSTFILVKLGLRTSVIIGMLGTCVGAWIKVVSVSPERFWVVLLGQSVVATSEVFMLGIPSRLAAVWFSSTEVSSACSIGVFGIQLGIAVGFILPPFLVPSQDKDAIEYGLYKMLITVAVITSIILILLFIFFKEGPPAPPSQAQLLIQKDKRRVANFFQSVTQLLTNPSFILLLVAYGINIGIFYTVSMLLNQIILNYYPNASVDAGRIGLIIVVAGMIGSVVCGVILDKFNQFKATILTVYGFCAMSMIAFAFILNRGLTAIYLVSALLGFFMTGFFPVGFELGAELTYPVTEDTSAGLLTAAGQLFGIIFMHLYTFVSDVVGDMWTNFVMAMILVLGFFLIACIRFDLRRQAVQIEKTQI